MKRKLFVLFLWLTTLPLFIQAAGNSWQTATLINDGKTLSGSLSNTNNEEWFKISVTENGQVSLLCTPGDGLKINYIRLYSLFNNELKQRGYAYVSSSQTTLTVNDIAKGTYYVKVEHYGGQGNYTLKYNFAPKSATHPNDIESNNDYIHAQSLNLNSSITGQLGYLYWEDTDNQDWFKIKVPENGIIDLECTPGDGLRMNYIRLYSLSGTELKERGYAYVSSSQTTLTVKNLAKGTYYAKVEHYSGEGGYALKNTFTPTSVTYPNDIEPNNDYVHAQSLNLNSSITGQLGYLYWDDTDNQDWFKIKVPENGIIDLECTPGDGLRMNYIRLYSLSGTELKERGYAYVSTSQTTLTVKNLAKGTYYAKVEHYSGEGGYALKNTFTPTSNEYTDDKEPNHDYTDAKLLRREHIITGHLGYLYYDDTDNEDWFKIVVPRNGRVKLTCTPGDGLRMNYIRLYSLFNNELQQRGYAYVSTDKTILTIDGTAPGTYYAKVERYNGEGGYTLEYNFEQPLYATDQEPNDQASQALTLAKGKTVSGHLGYSYWDDTDKADWYEIKVSTKGTVHFVCAPGEGLKMNYIRLYQGDSQKGYAYISSSETGLTINDLAAGTYQLKVEHYSGQGYYLLAYDSKLGSVEKQDPLPPDEDTGVPDEPDAGTNWQDADQIVGGQTVTGGMNDTVKDAWYKVIVGKDGTAQFTIRLDDKLDIGYMELCYMDNEGNVKRRFSNSIDAYPKEQKTLTVNDLAPGTYYLHINHWSGDGQYTLRYLFNPNSYDNDNEPNDTWQDARQLARNHSTTGHLGYQYYNDLDEIDWYKINVPRDGRVTLTLTQHDDLDIYYMSLNVVNANNEIQERNSIDNGTNQENKIETADIAAGTYYVKVQRYSGPGGYTLNYKFEQNEYASDQEPNDQWTNAQTLIDGEPTSGHLGYYALSSEIDVEDWFAIDVPQKSTVELTIRLGEALDIHYMTMYYVSDNELKAYSGGSTDAYYGEEKKLTLSNVEAGRYFICVHQYSGADHYRIGYNCKVDGVKPQDELPVEPNEPGSGENNSTVAGYLFAWMNNGMYTAYPLSHRPKITMSGTTFTLTTTQTTVTYEAKDVLKFTLGDINGNALGIDEVIHGSVSPTIQREPDALYIKGCVPGTAITIYTTSGKAISMQRADSHGTATVTLGHLPQGIYIVKSGNATIKITRK